MRPALPPIWTMVPSLRLTRAVRHWSLLPQYSAATRDRHRIHLIFSAAAISAVVACVPLSGISHRRNARERPDDPFEGHSESVMGRLGGKRGVMLMDVASRRLGVILELRTRTAPVARGVCSGRTTELLDRARGERRRSPSRGGAGPPDLKLHRVKSNRRTSKFNAFGCGFPSNYEV